MNEEFNIESVLKAAGRREPVPAAIETVAREHLRREWRAIVAERQGARRRNTVLAMAASVAAAVVGLSRLAELAGLMESDLAEAKKSGSIRGGRTHQVADAAKAIADGAAAAAKGEEEPPDVGRSLAQLFST